MLSVLAVRKAVCHHYIVYCNHCVSFAESVFFECIPMKLLHTYVSFSITFHVLPILFMIV